MNRLFLLLVLAVVGCATAPNGSIEVQAHSFEVPRNPYPAYHPDGVVITRLDGDSAWTKAGLRVGDVIESVNGEPTLTPEHFSAASGDRVRKVRVRGSRMGTYGSRLVAVEVG